VFATTTTFAGLVVLVSLLTLLVYLVCCLATIKLQRMDVRAEGATPFSLPGGPVIPIAASAIIVWLISSSTTKEFLSLGAMLAVSTMVFLIMRLRRPAVAPAGSIP
jgi:L-asparagine transporter-like permease